ncbi:uncharacterized protein LOC124854448 [Hippoglossus stenolepis]|uniref:uncharacterized protein LOC124854448 n=1 Tax=Hippoglossus stenolepis TaxID=195615 RepID=UPI001FAF7261|nr:uncharacterized protein LOC124854448 [Hippoglossus stenolepis]
MGSMYSITPESPEESYFVPLAISREELRSVNNEEFSAEGSTVTLSYNYTKVNTGDYFFWYRQYPGQAPEFLLYISGLNVTSTSDSLKSEQAMGSMYSITPESPEEVVSEGRHINLTCKYNGSIYNIQWYRQQQRSRPEFLLLITEDGSIHPTLLTDMNNTHLAAMGSMYSITPESPEEVVSEGRHINLTCKYNGSIDSIQWYRQQQRSRPEFLLYITEDGSIHPTLSDFSAHINQTEKRVKLQISSAAVTDSAVYYCAVKPTVTGNYTTLYKNSSCQKPPLLTAHLSFLPPLEGDITQ